MLPPKPRPEPIPALFASIRESYPGEIQDLNEVLAQRHRAAVAENQRLQYGDYVAASLAERGFTPDVRQALLWRGLAPAHPGATPDDLRFAADLTTAANETPDPVEAFSTVLAACPSGSRSEVGVQAYRKNPPFFTVTYSPAHVNSSELDSGVALMVKALPLVGVWSWSSCDGHHFLGKHPFDLVGAATIRLADDWYSEWLGSILRMLNRHHYCASQWTIEGRVLTVRADPSKTMFEQAFQQDLDLVRAGSFLVRSDVFSTIQRVKRSIPKSSSGRERAFKAACREVELLEFGND